MDWFSYIRLFVLFLVAEEPGISGEGLPPRIHSLNMLEPIPIQDVVGLDILRLDCSASGNPVPVLNWSFNGVRFVAEQLFGSGTVIRHTVSSNRLTIQPINSKMDTGKYRCIATNSFGSVFLEKHIKVRELGEFDPGSTSKDQSRKFYPTIGRPFAIDCPPHRTGYGTTFSWGIVHERNRKIDYVVPTIPIKNAFPNKLTFQYMYVTNDNIKRSRDSGGIQCIMKNLGQFVASVKSVLWNPYATRMESRKPRMAMFMKPQMSALVNTEFSLLCGAVNFPQAKISWQYQGQGIRSRWLNNSRELNFEFYRLLAGGHRLSIRRVTKYTGGTFKCFAENALGRIWKIGQLTVMFPPKWTTKFPIDVNVPVGNEYQINCTASGVPIPKYEWYHNGSIIQTDLHRKVEGGLLTMMESRYNDDGIYICLAISPLDTLSQSTYIVVTAMPPQFVVPIADPIYIFKQENQHIPCKVIGGPIPTISWFHNDVELLEEELEGYEILDDGTLRIKEVTNAHAGKFKCVATNAHGIAEGEGNVDLVEPTIITHPPANLTYQVGWPYLTMFCGASYDKRLDLRIEWYKGGVRLMKFVGHVALEGRSSGPPRLLFIDDVTVDDRGNYSCHAYTKIEDVISEQWAHGRLRIKGPPEPAAGVAVKGSCYDYNAKIVWSRGEELEAPTRKFYVEFKTPNATEWFTGHKPGEIFFAEPGTITYFDLNQRHLPPGANLIFRLKSASDHLIGRPSKPSKVGECITPPGPPMINPYNVSSYTEGPGTFFIKWKPVTDVYLGAVEFKYKVSYKVEKDAAFIVKEIEDSKIGMYTVENPGRGVKYQFSVQSTNSLGDGPEPLLYSNFSGKELPTQQPRFLRVEMILRYHVELRWETVPGADGYQVTYWNVTDSEAQRGHTPEYFRKRRDVASDTPYDMKTQLFIGREYKNGASLANLTADQEFMASVAAVNNGGVGPDSYPVTFRTAERVPAVPTRVRFQTYGRSARIQWNPPDDPNGYIEEYRVIWYTTDPHDRSAASKIESKGFLRPLREAYLLNVFTPLIYYTIKLQCRNRIGPGADWQRELMAVSVGDIPGKPDAPTLRPFDDTSINVTFNLASYGGFPTKFRVIVRERTFYYKQQMIYEQAFPNRTWVLVKGLKFITYDFHLVAINEYGQSETGDVAEQRPIRRPKRQARAHTFEWWRSNYFILMCLILLFLILFGLTIFLLLRKNRPKLYAKLPEEKKIKRTKKVKAPKTQRKFRAGGLFKKHTSKPLQETRESSIEQLIDEPPPYPSIDDVDTGITKPQIIVSSTSDTEEKIDVDDEIDEKKTYTSRSETGSESRSETGSSYTSESGSSEYSTSESETEMSKSQKYTDDESSKVSSAGGFMVGAELARSTEVLSEGVKVATMRRVTDEKATANVARDFFL